MKLKGKERERERERERENEEGRAVATINTYTRTVTNVGEANSSYDSVIVALPGVNVTLNTTRYLKEEEVDEAIRSFNGVWWRGHLLKVKRATILSGKKLIWRKKKTLLPYSLSPKRNQIWRHKQDLEDQSSYSIDGVEVNPDDSSFTIEVEEIDDSWGKTCAVELEFQKIYMLGSSYYPKAAVKVDEGIDESNYVKGFLSEQIGDVQGAKDEADHINDGEDVSVRSRNVLQGVVLADDLEGLASEKNHLMMTHAKGSNKKSKDAKLVQSSQPSQSSISSSTIWLCNKRFLNKLVDSDEETKQQDEEKEDDLGLKSLVWKGLLAFL
ncbi:hypothetical protein HYC85_007309 [Camellia sinensis]|uniref:Uncharacterized protein n=1 Tax=Camellia sinensis TaxID=4442 RepID=A0A7J7HNK9_CAMSI|nr:hypothetical protein HYC85_007309 [Camellia sinensis]